MFTRIEEVEGLLNQTEAAYPFTEERFPGWDSLDDFGKKKFGIAHQAKRLCVLIDRIQHDSLLMNGSKAAEYGRKVAIAATRLAVFADVQPVHLLVRAGEITHNNESARRVYENLAYALVECLAAAEPFDRMRSFGLGEGAILRNRAEKLCATALIFARCARVSLADLATFLKRRVGTEA